MPSKLRLQLAAGELERPLLERAGQPMAVSPAEVVRRDLGRYYTLIRDELDRLALSLDEASVVIAALNGTVHTAQDYRHLWTRVEDHLRFAAEDRAADAEAAVALSADELQEREARRAWGDATFGAGPGADEAAARLGPQGASVLVAKLRRISPGAAMAVIDAAERYHLVEGGHLARLTLVGLVRP